MPTITTHIHPSHDSIEDHRDFRCKVCSHWRDEHSDANGCAGCDAGKRSESAIMHKFVPDTSGDVWYNLECGLHVFGEETYACDGEGTVLHLPDVG